MKKLKVQGRYLAWDTGEPFFYLGDTAWELFHRLEKEEIAYYMKERARQGFTAIQAVALAEFEGVTVPNRYGRLPLLFTDGMPDPEKPDLEGEDSYWKLVDFAVEEAAKQGLFITMLPTWGDKFHLCWGKGPVIFTEENSYTYGKWIADRYKDCWNIIWMLGGDRPLEEKHRKIIDAMAKGIREVDPNHLITFHPNGATDSTMYVGDAEYIDFHTSQTGHGIEHCYRSEEIMLKMGKASEKPYMDSEPRYENHPACFNDQIGYFWNAEEVRQNLYWNLMAGVCGHTYGNHCIWSMNREVCDYFPCKWEEALLHEGAEQVHFAKELRQSRDYFSLQYAPEVLAENYAGMGHMTAAKGKDYAYVYSPLGVPFTVNLDVFQEVTQIRASWFDPRTGKETVFGILPPEGKTMVVPPTQGKGQDWILILDKVYAPKQ